VFSAVLEACAFVPAYSRVSASLFLFLFFNCHRHGQHELSGVDTQGVRSAPRPKRKRGQLWVPEGTIPSFASQNQSAVLSHNESDTEDIGVSSQPSSH